MASHIAQWASGYDLLLVLGIGTAVIFVLAAVASRLLRSPAAKAAVWRTAVVSVFLLLLLETTGLAQAIVQLARQKLEGGVVVQKIETRGPGDMQASETGGGKESENGNTGPVVSDLRVSATPREPIPLPPPESVSPLPVVSSAPALPLRASPSPAPTPAHSFRLMALWALGTVAVLCWMVAGRVAAGRFRRCCAMVTDEQLSGRVAALKTRLSIRRPVAVLASSRAMSPIVLGGWRPALVLPATFTQDFDPPQQETILAHELAHLAARDAVWQAAAFFLCALLWWHPLAWWSRRRLRAAHEALADEASLIVPDGPRILAEALVRLGQRLLEQQPRFGLALGGGLFRSGQYSSGLGRRVQRLLNLPQRRWQAPRRTRMAFVHISLPALLALAAILGTAWAPSQVPITQGETTMNVLTSSWRCSLMATALCVVLGNSPAPAAADNTPPSTAPTATTDRQKLEEQLRSLHDKIDQLEKQGKHDEAEKLRHEARELYTKLRGTSGASASTAPAAMTPEKQKIVDQIKQTFEKAKQLEQSGKHDEAEKLRQEARALYAKLNPSTGPATAPTGPSPERQKLYEQYKALHEKIEAAKKAGNSDEVHHLMQEMDALHAKLRSQEGSPARNYSTNGGDRAARMQHLRSAAENLKAAGCDAEAQHVIDLIRHMEAEGNGSSSRYAPQGRTAPSTSNPAYTPGPRSADGASQAAVQELRGQVEQMHREMRELREELNRAKSGDHR